MPLASTSLKLNQSELKSERVLNNNNNNKLNNLNNNINNNKSGLSEQFRYIIHPNITTISPIFNEKNNRRKIPTTNKVTKFDIRNFWLSASSSSPSPTSSSSSNRSIIIQESIKQTTTKNLNLINKNNSNELNFYPNSTMDYEILIATTTPPNESSSVFYIPHRTERSIQQQQQQLNIPDDNNSSQLSIRSKRRRKSSPLDRNERSANLSHITGATRKIQLYIKNRYLQLLPDGTVNGTQDELSDFSE